MEEKQAFNPFLPEYEYIPDGEPHVLETEYMYMDRMINLVHQCFV